MAGGLGIETYLWRTPERKKPVASQIQNTASTALGQVRDSNIISSISCGLLDPFPILLRGVIAVTNRGPIVPYVLPKREQVGARL